MHKISGLRVFFSVFQYVVHIPYRYYLRDGRVLGKMQNARARYDELIVLIETNRIR